LRTWFDLVKVSWSRVLVEPDVEYSADDRDWLLWLGTDAKVHRLELLLDNLERHLKAVRETIRSSCDSPAANKQFIRALRAELDDVRSRPLPEGDPLGFSYQLLKRFAPMLRHWSQQLEDVEGLMSLFDEKVNDDPTEGKQDNRRAGDDTDSRPGLGA
jgi:hypothetical protein